MTVLKSIVLLIGMACAVSAADFDKFHSHAHGKMFAKLNYDSLFNEATPLEKTKDAQILIEKCIEHYGGTEALESVKGVEIEYATKLLMKGGTITVKKSRAEERRYKIIRDEPKGKEIRILNGAKAWFAGRDTVLTLNSGRYKSELFSYLTLSMPLAMKTEPFSEIRYGYRADDSLAYIYMKKQDSLMIILGIDPQKYTINTSEGVIYQDTSTFVFINLFSDFKKFEGILFPHTMSNVSMGLEVARSTINTIELNPAFKEETFLPPENKEDIGW